MLLTLRILLILFGFIAIGTGFMGMTGSYNPEFTDVVKDNNHRYVAAIWTSMSLAFFYVAWKPSETVLFRFLMLAVFIGCIVRAFAFVYYEPTPTLIFIIFIELIPIAIMFWIHNKLLNSGTL